MPLKKSINIASSLPLIGYPIRRIQTSPLAYRLASGSFWVLTGTALSRGLMLLSYVFVARMLRKEVFGEFGIVQSTVGMFGIFAGLGLGMTATKYIAEFRKTDPAKAGRILTLTVIVVFVSGSAAAVVYWILAPWLAQHTLAAAHLAGVLRLGTLFMLLSALNGVQLGALSGFEAFRSIARISLLAGLATFPLIVLGTWAWDLSGAILGLIAGQGVMLVLFAIDLRSEIQRAGMSLVPAGCMREWRTLCGFSLPVFLSGVMVVPVTWACCVLLVNQPGGYAENGIFTAANQWFVLLLFLPDRLSQVNLPMLSDHIGRGDYRGASKIMLLCLKINIGAVVPVGLILCFAGEFVMGFYGSGFEGAWLTLLIIVVTAFLSCIHKPLGQVLVAAGRAWALLFFSVVWGSVFFFGTHCWVGNGANGLASARLLAYLLYLTLMTTFVVPLLLKGLRIQNRCQAPERSLCEREIQ